MARNSGSASKISVWWDIENCHVPRNVDPYLIAQNLNSTVHHANLNGPITINVFGDTRIVDHATLEALSSTGISVHHIPRGNKDASDKAILVAMLFWALDNPPPAHFLLISGDGDYANALHRLRLKGYDVLLVRPDQHVKPALINAATSVWFWTDVAKGKVTSIMKPREILPSTLFVEEELKDKCLQQQNFPSSIRKPAAAVKRQIVNVMQCNKQPGTPGQKIKLEQCQASGGQQSSHASPLITSAKNNVASNSKKDTASAELYSTSKKEMILKKLKSWLMETVQTRLDYDVSLVRKDFECATGLQLDHKMLGYVRLKDLIIGEFADVITISSSRPGLQVLAPVMHWDIVKPTPIMDISCLAVDDATTQTCEVKKPDVAILAVSLSCASTSSINEVTQNSSQSILQEKCVGSQALPLLSKATCNHPTMQKLRNWLLQLPITDDGYDISRIRMGFQQSTGIVLDPKLLGYAKMKDVISVFLDFHVESPKMGLFLVFHKRESSEVGVPKLASEVGTSKPHTLLGADNFNIILEQSSTNDVGHEDKNFENDCRELLSKEVKIKPHLAVAKACNVSSVRIEQKEEVEHDGVVLKDARTESETPPLLSASEHASSVAVTQPTAVCQVGESTGISHFQFVGIGKNDGESSCVTKNHGIQMLHDFEVLLAETLSKCPDGYMMGKLKQDFKLRYGYELDQKLAGFSKLQGLLKEFAFVSVEPHPQGAYKIIRLKEQATALSASVTEAGVIGLTSGAGFELNQVNTNGIEHKDTKMGDDSRDSTSRAMLKIEPYLLGATSSDEAGVKLNVKHLNCCYLHDRLQLEADIRRKHRISSSLAGEHGMQMMHDVEVLLTERLFQCPDGYLMAKLKPDFKLRFGYELDQKLAGFTKLQDLLNKFTFLCVESHPQGPHKMIRWKADKLVQ